MYYYELKYNIYNMTYINTDLNIYIQVNEI